MDSIDVKQLNVTGGANRFKFQSFSDRIQNIRVDAFRKIRGPSDADEDTESFFRASLDEWAELNCTAHFTAFRREIRPMTESLVQILYHKEQITDAIQRHLAVPGSLAIEPILSLTTALARDLQEELYPFVPALFPKITALVSANAHPSTLNVVFNSIASLFKYLSRELLVDIERTFDLLVPVFRHPKIYVRIFAAESFGFLLRKVKGADNQNKVFAHILEQLRVHSEDVFVESVSLVFFEAIKQVKTAFNSRGAAILETVLRLAATQAVDDRSRAPAKAMEKLFVLSGHYGRADSMAELWTAVVALANTEADAAAAATDASESARRFEILSQYISALRVWVGLRKGSRIHDQRVVFTTAEKLCTIVLQPGSKSSASSRLQLVHLLSLLIECAPMETMLVSSKNILTAVACTDDIRLALSFFRGIDARGVQHFARIVLSYALACIQRSWTTDPEACIIMLAEMFPSSAPGTLNDAPHALKDKHGLLRFPESDFLASSSSTAVPESASRTKDIAAAILDYIEARMSLVSTEETDAIGRVHAAITSLSSLSLPYERFGSLCQQLVRTISGLLASEKPAEDMVVDTANPTIAGDSREILKSLAGSVLVALCSRAARMHVSVLDMWPLVMTETLATAGTNQALLDGIATYAEMVAQARDQDQLEAKTLLGIDGLQAALAILKSNIGSYYAPVRLNTLRILAVFEQMPLRPVQDATLHGPCPFIQICLDIERLPNDVATVREKTILLRRIDALLASRTMPNLYAQLPSQYLCALFTVNFSPLWPDVAKSLKAAASADSIATWTAISLALKVFEKDSSIDQPSFSVADKMVSFEDTDSVHDDTVNDGDATLHDQDQGMDDMGKYLGIDEDDDDNDDNDEEERTETHVRFKRKGKSKDKKTASKFNKISFECTNLVAFGKHWQHIHVQFRCPVRAMVTMFVGTTEPRRPHLDASTIYCQVVRALGDLSSLFEKQSKHIVPLFLAMFRGEYDGSVAEVTPADFGQEDETTSSVVTMKPVVVDEPTTTSHARAKILEFLAAFSKATRLNKFSHGDELFAVFRQLLTKGETKIQQRALDCIIAWKQPGVVARADHLKALVEDDKFRDALSTLDMEEIRGTIKIVDQPALMGTIVRILYGKLVSRRGRNSSKAGLRARRTAIFAFLASVADNERQYMVDLMLEPFTVLLSQQNPTSPTKPLVLAKNLPRSAIGPLKKQIGFLTVLGDFVKQLRTLIIPFLPSLIKTVLYLVDYAEQAIVANAAIADADGDQDVDISDNDKPENDDDIVMEPVDTLEVHELAQLREVRVLGIRRLTQIFNSASEFDYTPYLPSLFESYIAPRVPRFHIENTQATSALLELLAEWSKHRRHVMYLSNYASELVPALMSLFSAKKVAIAVVNVVVGIIESILLLDSQYPDDGILRTTLLPHLSHLLITAEHALQQSLHGKDGRSVRLIGETLPARIIRVLSQLSVHVVSSDNADTLINMLVPMLKRPSKTVPETTKGEILQILGDFVPILSTLHSAGGVCRSSLYPTLCQLLESLRSREARVKILYVFHKLAVLDPDALTVIVELLDDMNSYSPKRMDEPDFNRRFGAFTRINEELHTTLTPAQWRPLLYNLVFHSQDSDDYSTRTSAAYGVQRFIAQAALRFPDGIVAPNANKTSGDLNHMDLVIGLVLPAIKRGITLQSSSVRHEFVVYLGALVRAFPTRPEFRDMVPLLANDDEEASFFNNIYHLQSHRRQRALQQLAQHCDSGALSSTNVSRIFAPLAIHVILESDRTHDHNAVQDAVLTVGSCAGVLRWNHYNALVKRVLGLMTRRQDIEKALVRTLIQVLERFHFDLKDVVIDDEDDRVDHRVPESATTETVAVDGDQSAGQEAAVVPDTHDGKSGDDGEDEGEEEEEEAEEQADGDAIMADAHSQLTTDNRSPDELAPKIPAAKIHRDVTTRLLPTLQKMIAVKDDDSVPVRIPLAIAIIRVLKQLPETTMKIHLPKLLMTMCNILTSHLQDTRDSTRDTLVKIAIMLGPTQLSYIIRELRTALKRGYQLHVLGYTLHAIMVGLVPTIQPGDIDECVFSIVQVCTHDIFGETGQERDVEALRSKMREIRSTQSYMTLELTACVMGLRHIDTVLLPIKELLLETNSSKVVQKVETVFRSLALGLNANTGIQVVDFMKFVHALVTENLPLAQVDKNTKKVMSNAERTYMVQMKRKDAVEPLKYFEANAHLFIEFGLALLLTALKRDRVQLREKAHLEMLDPLVDVLGRSMYSRHPTVIVIASRILAVILHAPLPSLVDALPAILKRTLQIVAKESSTASELVQACFRFLTVLLRDCPSTLVTERQIVTLAGLVESDLEDPERQSTTFSLIRAILSRKCLAKEVYDLMDAIVRLAVTSQSKQVREHARHAHMQFLLTYPHGHVRFRKQMMYLIKNLEYEHESGRLSVLETLHMALDKFSDAVILEYVDMLFVALVMVVVNDSSATCRKMAAALVIALLKRLDVSQAERSIALSRKWFSSDKPALRRTGAQVFGLVVQAYGERAKQWVPGLLEDLADSIALVDQEFQARLNGDDGDDDADSDGEGGLALGGPTTNAATGTATQDTGKSKLGLWELGYYCLNTFIQTISAFPDVLRMDITSKNAKHIRDIWTHIESLMLHPHQWIRSLSAKSFGLLFAQMDPVTRRPRVQNTNAANASSRSEHPVLANDRVVRRIASRCCAQLDSEYLNDDLATQIVKNLVFLGRCLVVDLTFGAAHVANQASKPLATQDAKDGGDEQEPDGTHEQDDQDKDEDAEVDIDDERQDTSVTTSARSLLWLMQRLSYLARADAGKRHQRGPLLRRSVFQWFAAISQFLPVRDPTSDTVMDGNDENGAPGASSSTVLDSTKPFYHRMIATLYHTTRDETAKGPDADSLRQLATEVMDHLQTRLGTTAYLDIYNAVHTRVQHVRQERRAQKSVLAVADPQASARRRLQRNEMKRAGRKRKAEAFASVRVKSRNSKRARQFEL